MAGLGGLKSVLLTWNITFNSDAAPKFKHVQSAKEARPIRETYQWNSLYNTFSTIQINVKKIAFGNKEHTTDKKMGVLVLLRLFISSNEVCKTAYAL